MVYTGYSVEKSTTSFLYKVYAWMGAALAITAATAYGIYVNPQVFNAIFNKPIIGITILIAQLGLVIALTALINRISLPAAIAIFLGYSFLTGVTFSAIFYTYSMSSIVVTFAICSGMFAFMALYGYFTRADLSSVGSFAAMGVFGLILAMVINIFWQNSTFDYIISLIGVAIFTVLTAYDMQRIKQLGMGVSYHAKDVVGKAALVGALTLYLDFINLFLMLLRLFGNRKD
jgi:FtsH-binding integral membrane protein